MNRTARLRGVLVPLVALVLAMTTAGTALAQGATITGRVTNSAGAPLRGATVIINSLNLGTQVNENGTYTLTVPATSANGQQVVLTARFIGYKPVQRTITLSTGSQSQDFSLEADPFRLEELVISGVADATSQRKLTISVARVSEDQVSNVPAGSPVQALQGKVAGARVSLGQGNPGANPAIRLRGSSSLQVGGNEPVIIVDGVITRGSLADIDANDIESLEVLKGPAAASFYGSDAANGVVNITTKRARNIGDNTTTFMVRSEYGQSGLQRLVPVNRYHAYELNADGTIATTGAGARILKADRIYDNPFPSSGDLRYRNQLDEWLTNGQFYSTNVQLGLRRGNTNVASSFTVDRNQGILPFKNGQLRRNLRLNVDQGLTDKLDLSMSVAYGLNQNDFSPDATTGWFELLQAPPDVDLKTPDPNNSDIPYFRAYPQFYQSNRVNPLYQLRYQDYNLRRERIIGSVQGRYRPTDWLSFEAVYGTDRLNSRNHTYTPRGYLTEGGTPGTGSMSIGTSNAVQYNAQVTATATRSWFDDQVATTTRLQYLYEQDDSRSLSGSGSVFTVDAVPDLDWFLTANRSSGSSMTMERTRDFAVVQDVDIRDRYLLSLLYRRDGSSLFGADERWADFYRVSGAYILTEDFQVPGFDHIKLRAARGTAGLRPGFAYQYETYSSSGGNPVKSTLGNRNLRVAEVAENEFGLEMAFLQRFNAEVVYADRVTEGAFLNVPLSSAQTGGFSSQWQNAADISAKTIEARFDALVVNRPDLTYSLTLTADRTTQKIDRMNRAPYRVNATGQQNQDMFYYKAGESLGIMYGRSFIRTLDQSLLQNHPGWTGSISDYVINPDGYVVLAANRGTPNELPLVRYDSDGNAWQGVIGDVNPSFSFGIANNITFKNFNIYALFDGVQGADIYNFTRQWMYQDGRHGWMGQGDRPASERIASGFYQSGLYDANNPNDAFVEDGSFVKLRELSVSYTFSPDLLNRVGASRYISGAKVALIGRNLYTWTDYSGFDPDVTAAGDFNFRSDGFRYPNFRQISGQIELRF
jgi:TonB-linked SusC/RagA family outer membrane protein